MSLAALIPNHLKPSREKVFGASRASSRTTGS
jgi:hypothetical protein